MTPLIPFAISAIGAVISELSGENQTHRSDEFGGVAPANLPAAHLVNPNIVGAVKKRKIVPSRFTHGTALANIAKAGTHKEDVTSTSPVQSDDDDNGHDTDEEVDPLEVVQRQIEQELIIDSVADEVVDEMELGFDPDLEESLPTDKEFLDKYEPLDAPDDEEFGGTHTRSIFAPGTGWGIRRHR